MQFNPSFVLNYKSVQILIFKTGQIPFNFQVSPFFFFTFKIVQIFNCKTVPFFHICRLVLKVKNKSIQSKKPRKQVQVHMAVPNWSRAHMAAYKRLATVQAPHNTIQSEPHHHKQKRNFSLFSVESKSQIQKNIQEHSNPNRFLQAIQGESMEFVWTLRDSSTNLHHWVTLSAIQASNSSPEATNPKRDHRVEIEKKKERSSRISNHRRRREENYRPISKFETRNQRSRIKFKVFRRFRLKSQIKTQVNSQTYLMSLKIITESRTTWINCKVELFEPKP